MAGAKKRSGSKRIYAVGSSVLLVLALTASTFLFACDNGKTPVESSASETTVPTAHVEDTTTEMSETTPCDTTVLTESVTESVSSVPPVTETVNTDPPVTEYIPPENRDTDFSGSLFIGDSRTEGLMLYSGVYGAKAYTARGLMVDTYFTSPAVDVNGSKVSVSQAVESNPNFERVYIMLGINELGWAYDSVFVDKYGKLVDHVKRNIPDAKIIVQSIIPVTAAKSESDEIFNNENIERFNGLIRNMCAEKGVVYMDLVPYMADASGALPEGAAFDGIHLQKPYCQKWLDCLKANMN